MGLSDGRKTFRIGLAVLIQYRSVTASQPPSHVAVAITLNAKASSLITDNITQVALRIFRLLKILKQNLCIGLVYHKVACSSSGCIHNSAILASVVQSFLEGVDGGSLHDTDWQLVRPTCTDILL